MVGLFDIHYGELGSNLGLCCYIMVIITLTCSEEMIDYWCNMDVLYAAINLFLERGVCLLAYVHCSHDLA